MLPLHHEPMFMPSGRLELPRHCWQQLLRLPCLPIPPRRLVVPMGRLELPRSCDQQILSLPCLPFHHIGLYTNIKTNYLRRVRELNPQIAINDPLISSQLGVPMPNSPKYQRWDSNPYELTPSRF